MRLFGLGKRVSARPAASLPDGMRAYAIGDVHGRLDLLTILLERIEEDDGSRAPADTHLIMLGDLIDRGPDSAGVVEMLRSAAPSFAQLHPIMGNHEEMLLRMIDAPSGEEMAQFIRYGGYETLASYGAPETMLEIPERYPADALTAFVPEAHRDFLRTFVDSVRLGDYLFVHAGIRPEVPIDRQAPLDLRWIRREFLDSDADHGVTVVHGHTISAKPEMRANRIGIDTGAYASGVLTALGLERNAQWLISTGG